MNIRMWRCVIWFLKHFHVRWHDLSCGLFVPANKAVVFACCCCCYYSLPIIIIIATPISFPLASLFLLRCVLLSYFQIIVTIKINSHIRCIMRSVLIENPADMCSLLGCFSPFIVSLSVHSNVY